MTEQEQDDLVDRVIDFLKKQTCVQGINEFKWNHNRNLIAKMRFKLGISNSPVFYTIYKIWGHF